MAGVKVAIRLQDMISSKLEAIRVNTDKLNKSISSVGKNQSFNSFEDSMVKAHGIMGKISATQMKIKAAINEATEAQKRYFDTVDKGQNSVDSLLKKAAGFAVAAAGSKFIKDIGDISDKAVSVKARLDLVVDKGQTREELEKKIQASANRSRANYLDTAAAVASLKNNAGSAFKDNNEIIAFLEGINKQFVIGGASASTQAGAMLQLSQAMAAGALRGDELNSVLEGAPQIARLIEKSMGWAAGSIKSHAEEGEVTAAVVKNAILSNIGDINKQFDSMPKTWGQVLTLLQNKALKAFQPVLDKVNELANNEEFMTGVSAGLDVMGRLALLAVERLEMLNKAVSWAVNNWGAISPVVYGITAAVGAYITAVKLAAIKITITTAALKNFAIALFTTPVGWFTLAIGAMGVGFAVLAKKAGGADMAITAIGYSFQDLWDKGSLFMNKIVQLAAIAGEKIKTKFLNAILIIENGFIDFKTFLLVTFNNVVNEIAKLSNKFLGTKFDTEVAITKNATIQAERDAKWKENNKKIKDNETKLKNAVEGYKMIYENKAAEVEENKRKRQEAYSQMYVEKVMGQEEAGIEDLLAGYQSTFDEIAGGIGDIAKNTEELKNNKDIADLIRDYHSMQATKNNTTQYITIDLSGQVNHIANSMDLAEVTNYMINEIRTAVETAPQGV